MSLDSPSTRKCLAFHGPLLYEARILHRYDPATGTITSPDSNTATTTSTSTAAVPPPPVPPELASAPCFYIHYQGWKATWDEWVAPERLREDTPANRELRKQLARDARAAKETKEPRPKEAREPRAGARGGRGRRAAQGGSPATATTNEGGSGDASPPAEDYAARVQQAAQRAAPRLQLHMPVPLKAVLVDDWEQVTKNKRVCKLPPRAPRLSVAALLQRYRADALRGDGAGAGDASPLSLVQQSLLEEYLRGLAEYFDAALPRLLLYRLERLQLAQLTQGKSADSGDALPPRALYGSVHLLRLLSVLPELLGGTAMGAGDSRVLLRQSEALLLWLAVHRDELFPGEGDADTLDADGDGYYVNTSSQYEGVAIGM